MKWYAVFVETGKEHLVQVSLRSIFGDSITCVVPSRRLPEHKEGQIRVVVKPMFPGYVLIKTQMDSFMYRTLKSVPRVYRVLGDGASEDTYCTPIDDAEMAPIIHLIGNGEVVPYSQVFMRECHYTVLSGPLRGMEHIIRKIDKRKRRAKIALQFGGVEKVVDVGIDLLDETCVPLDRTRDE